MLADTGTRPQPPDKAEKRFPRTCGDGTRLLDVEVVEMRHWLDRYVLYCVASLLLGACCDADCVLRRQEATLRMDLATFRAVLSQYREDNGVSPPTLATLVSAGYLRVIPRDPMTKRSDTWIEISDIAPSGPRQVVDVRSGAPGPASDGSLYRDW